MIMEDGELFMSDDPQFFNRRDFAKKLATGG